MIDPPSTIGWHQLYQLWQLVVLVCRFLWRLLQFLGGR